MLLDNLLKDWKITIMLVIRDSDTHDLWRKDYILKITFTSNEISVDKHGSAKSATLGWSVSNQLPIVNYRYVAVCWSRREMKVLAHQRRCCTQRYVAWYSSNVITSNMRSQTHHMASLVHHDLLYTASI